MKNKLVSKIKRGTICTSSSLFVDIRIPKTSPNSGSVRCLASSHSKYSFLSSLDISDSARNTLSHMLDLVVEGTEEVITSPLADYGPSELFEEWYNFLMDNLPNVQPLIDLEESNSSKYGPRSIAVPWPERREQTYGYFEGIDNAVSHLNQNVKPPLLKRLRPFSLENASQSLRKYSNSGLPFLKKKSKVLEEAVADFNYLYSRNDPCVTFTRTQDQRKTRTVWGYPLADTLQETRYYRPLLEVQRKEFYRSALVSPDATDRAIDKMIRESEDKQLLSMDFSLYDTTIKAPLQSMAFDYIGKMFQVYGPELHEIKRRFNEIALITPDGILRGKHGVPSGSTFTNEVDSIVQYLIVKSYHEEIGNFQIQGDDAAYCVSDAEDLIEFFNTCNLNINKDKSYIASDYIVYLQCLYHKSLPYKDGIIRGIYPTMRALGKLVYQERFETFKEYGIKGSDYYAIRSLCILENCKHHPLFKEFVDFIVSKDKYGLRPTEQGIRDYVNMTLTNGSSGSMFVHQAGDDVSGIKDFESFKIVMNNSDPIFRRDSQHALH